jgi:hypothetical protein
MNPSRHTDARFGDPEDRRPQHEAPQQPEPREPEPLSGVDTPYGPVAGSDHATIPSTPGELVAMQRLLGERRTLSQWAGEGRVEQALTLLGAEELNPWESQQIALALLQQLESYHRDVVAEMQDSPESTPAQMACWAIDGDRLMHGRRLLESITLI